MRQDKYSQVSRTSIWAILVPSNDKAHKTESMPTKDAVKNVLFAKELKIVHCKSQTIQHKMQI
ncbi:hypothetical protein FACS1894180_6520 [Bacteroidia bacterium]|nr:hypothetical protein FACS1894180_6520 [Bacteroidia bacterium]